jgi:glycosyltransferase involved in cell wall biosynthesis/peptidoglycan/xylan/chitin deacetylase (PgdA/CDA1 family)
MRFSVVICTLNRRQTLKRTLPTILEQSLAPADYEVIVVVDGSTDGTADMLRAMPSRCLLRILEQPNKGLALARNAGLEATQGECVIFLDDDILCANDLLQRHLEMHESLARQSVVFGPVLVAPDSLATSATWWTEAYTEEYVARLERDGEARWPRDMVMEVNYSAPRELLLRSGGNDPLFSVRRQSADWGLRLHGMGVNFVFVPQARVWQLFVKCPEGVVRDAWWYGRSEVLLSRRFPEYRRHSMMARMREGRWMPMARRAVARLPVSMEPLLRPATWATSALGRLPVMRRAAIRVLELRQGIPMLRGAVAESGSWQALQREFGAVLPVLIFHHVGELLPGASPGLTVSPGKFRSIVRWLVQQGFSAVSPMQWLRWLGTGEPLPDKPILLTFDDALEDLVEHAFPILREHGCSAGVFVVTRQVSGTNAWADRGAGLYRCMSAGQIRDWSRQGIEFGAHSRTHADLTSLSPAALEEEVGGSRRELEDILGRSAPTFAYPFGYLNESVVACARRHFDLAFSCIEGINSLATDPHMLRRTMALPSDFGADLALRARFGRSSLHTLKAHLRIRSRLRALSGRAG